MQKEENRIEKLINEVNKNREELQGMINDIKGFRQKLDELLPTKVDYKNRFILLERMKTVTQIIQAELSVRKQIDDSIKTEMDMRNKNEFGDEIDRMSPAEKLAVVTKILESRGAIKQKIEFPDNIKSEEDVFAEIAVASAAVADK